MHDVTITATLTSDTPDLTAAARRAEAWFGEPFLHADEDPDAALAPGTARRALDDALDEMEAGHAQPSSRWKVRYGLMLGLERVLTEDLPRTATGTELRRHQVDALAGMLAELIASTQRAEKGTATAAATEPVAEAELDEEPDDDFDAGFVDEGAVEDLPRRRSRGGAPVPLPPSDGFGQDDRGGRLRRGGAAPRHPDPHAPPAPRLAVQARPHDRGLRRPLHRTP